MNHVNIAIADDHQLFRKGLIALLESEPGFRVPLEVGSGTELLREIKKHSIDVVLMDIEMPDINGIDVTRELQSSMPDTRVVMLSAYNNKAYVMHAFDSGARGYLLKDTAPGELVEAVNTVMQNGFCFNNNISHILLKGIVEKDKLKSTFNAQPQLTDRELEILQLICMEMTNVEIGEKLFLSSRTVEGHRQHMLEKIGARNTVGLVIYAIKNRLVNITRQ